MSSFDLTPFINDAVQAVHQAVDEEIKSLFKEAFEAGMKYADFPYEYPDFEEWFAALVERLKQ